MKKTIALSLMAASLSSCITVPVAVITDKGDVLRGTASTGIGNGTFQASGKVKGKETTCAGNYNSLDGSQTISIPVHCNNGQKGIVIATRDNSGLSGSGRIRMTDGSQADFIFGSAANAF